MADTSGWGVLIGLISGATLEALRSNLSSRQARRARKAERLIELDDRQVQFEIDTLTKFEDALAKLARLVTRTHLENMRELRETGKYGYRQLPDDVGGDSSIAINREVSKLAARIIDDNIRASVRTVQDIAARFTLRRFDSDDGSDAAVETDSMLDSFMRSVSETLEAIGSKLRDLYLQR